MTNYKPTKALMELAISEAQKAREAGDYAIGAVVVKNGNVLASSGNRVQIENDATQHAEVAAIRKACAKAGTRHIEGTVLYSTAEPCPMCASAAIWARMEGIVFGSLIEDMNKAEEELGSADCTWRTIGIDSRYILDNGNPKPFSISGFMRKECRELFHR